MIIAGADIIHPRPFALTLRAANSRPYSYRHKGTSQGAACVAHHITGNAR